MSKQYNKILKRRRRQRYIKRKKLAAKQARTATAASTAAPAAPRSHGGASDSASEPTTLGESGTSPGLSAQTATNPTAPGT